MLSPSFIGRIERRLRRANLNASARAIAAARPRDQDGFHADHGLFGNELVRQAMDADVVHLHWINDFIELPTFLPAVARLKPVVWTHHDLHGITGGCHYPKGCQNWKTGCVQCPQLTLAPTSSLAATIWSRQNATIASCPPNSLHLIAASRWVEDCLRAAPRFASRPSVRIPYGLDTQVFRPRDKSFSRDLLDLPRGARAVLFVSDATRNPRKGLDVLARAIAEIKDRVPNLLLVSVGQASGPIIDGVNVAHRHLGAFDDDRWLSLAYSAADVFVIPSLEEAYGQTMLESLACGTPVVGSHVGGIPDLISPDVNGLLVPPGTPKALGEALVQLLSDEILANRLGQAGREHIERHHSLSAYAEAHQALYQSILL